MKASCNALNPVIQRVVLRTANAARLAAFYETLLGLIPREEKSGAILLQHPLSGNDLVILQEDPEARLAPAGAPGLFHIAFLFEELEDWRSAVRSAVDGRGLQGAADHGVSWAVYLEDPEGNGLELAWDKPAAEWPWSHDGRIEMVSRALPLRSILLNGAVKAPRESPGRFSIGHLHLQVPDLRCASDYQKNLDLAVTQSNYAGTLFMARGRYHHHLAVNHWGVDPRVTRPENALGLVAWTIHREPDFGSRPLHPASGWREPSGAHVRFDSERLI